MALLAALGACKAAPLPPPVAAASSDQVTLKMELRITEAGQPKADLTADTAITRQGQTVTDLKKVHLLMYEPGRRPSDLKSKTGEYDQQGGMMTARGNVVLVTQGDKGATRTITTEELHWDQRGDRVWSTLSTTIVENGQTAVSDGFTSNSAFTNLQGRNSTVKGVKVGEGGFRF